MIVYDIVCLSARVYVFACVGVIIFVIIIIIITFILQ